MRDMRRYVSIMLISASLAVFSASGTAAESDDKNLNDYSCKDVMRFSGEHREIAIALLHGYFLGKQGKTAFNTDTLSGRTDKFIEHCLDNPAVKALDSMAKVSK
ncbi:MAG: HdeA/HdeB family chaperone [Gammaproteobacteria bacterium]